MRTAAVLLFGPALSLLTACGGGSDKVSDSASEDCTGDDCGGGSGGGLDADGDGFSGDDDCDDSDGSVYLGAPELCDGLDNDCDGALHEDEQDVDGDGTPDCAACEVAGHWELLRDGVSGDALRTALQDGNPDPECEYSYSKRAIYQSFDLEEGNVVECVYTGEQVAIVGGSPEDDAMNIEHTWPRSEGAESDPANCDVHHLFPTIVAANESRGNSPLGDVTGSTYWSSGGSVSGAGAGGTVFEPRDAHKGNAARSMLYVWTQYGYAPSSSQQSMYASWSALDPVTATDQERDAATARYQFNHNPFVACPAFVDRMLGGG